MEFYKPYSFLYEDASANKLTASFIVYLHAEEKLSSPSISTRNNKTTITYSIETDTSHTVDYTKEVDEVLDWDGNDHTVVIIIGSGSGGSGGTATIDSGGFR